MKDLKYYIKKLYISLDGIDEELKDKIQNLEGYKINECCGCCDCGAEYCDEPCEPECGKCCDPYTSPNKIPVNTNQFGRFNSECEIIRELDTKPTVNTLFDIHSQFGRFNFVKDVKRGHIEPLYFGHKEYGLSGETVNRENGDMPTKEIDSEAITQLYDVATIQNKKIYKVVNDIVDTFELVTPIIQTKINGEVQIYAVKHTGTNGKENSIKSSLEEIARLLGKLDSKSEVKWSQVLDVSIDNIDDLYSFVVTFVLDENKVRETIKAETLTPTK